MIRLTRSTKNTYRSGQALVILLFYMIIAITLTTTAVAVIVSNSLSVTETEQSIRALQMAEAGAENAIVRILRNTNYQGETLTIGDGSATVTVNGNFTKQITSIGTVGNFSRALGVQASMSGGILSITSWEEQ